MPHNESQSERKLEQEPVVEESVKLSKLTKIKSAAITAGIATIPVALTVAPAIFAYKTGKMNFDAAKLNLETAKLANLAQQAIQS